MIKEQSEKQYKKALNLMPGGVNSPVRAFKSVGGTPLFMAKGDGCYVWDIDGNKYTDFCCSWGPLILGHNYPSVREAILETVVNGTTFGTPTIQENELAHLIIEHNRFIDKIRFVSSGTEAVMSAIRLARGYTGKTKVVKFEGCYHGHVDHLLVKAGSGLATFGESTSAGVPESFAKETLVIPLNDADQLQKVFESHSDIACVIIEPIPANNGLLLQDKVFLTALREICTKHNVLLIFDEVISGFRVGFEGAAGYYDIAPDIVTYGKIIGGGMPVGAYGASDEVMEFVAPLGPVYQAGTLSGNPVAMAAGYAQLTVCLSDGFYEEQASNTLYFIDIINKHAVEQGYALKLFSVGSIYWFAFTAEASIASADKIDGDSMSLFAQMHANLLEKGVYLAPSGYEVGFISKAHTKEVLYDAALKICDALDIVFQNEKGRIHA